MNDFAIEEYQKSLVDPEVVHVFGNWSTCMKAAGFHYSDPLEPFRDPTWANSRRSSTQEIRVAEANVRCTQQTNLVSVWAGVEERNQRGVIGSHPEDFAGFMRGKNAELDAARRVLKELG